MSSPAGVYWHFQGGVKVWFYRDYTGNPGEDRYATLEEAEDAYNTYMCKLGGANFLATGDCKAPDTIFKKEAEAALRVFRQHFPKGYGPSMPGLRRDEFELIERMLVHAVDTAIMI